MKKITVMSTLLALVCILSLATANYREATAPPHNLIGVLEEIRDAITPGTSDIEQREGYCQYFKMTSDSNEVVLTVPTGKRFVLLKLYTYKERGFDTHRWSLLADENMLLNGHTVYASYYDSFRDPAWTMSGVQNLPDRCVTAEEGETLTLVNGPSAMHATVIGYFYNVE